MKLSAYKVITKRGRIGYGGMRCACCNRFYSGHSQKSTKRALNKVLRHMPIETE